MAKTAIGNGYRRIVETITKARKVEEGIARMAENARRTSDLAKRLDKATQEPSKNK